MKTPTLDRILTGGTPGRDIYELPLRECWMLAKELKQVVAQARRTIRRNNDAKLTSTKEG